jgi:predicted DNA-binding transcriptional regulator AlpA
MATEYLTDRQLARLLQLSQGTIRGWRSADKGPKFIRAVGSIRYPVDELRRWLDQERAA